MFWEFCRYTRVGFRPDERSNDINGKENPKIDMRLKLLTVLCAIAIGLNAQPDTDLDKMIGQMVMVGLSDFDKPDRRETTLNLIKEGKVGGIVLFEKDLEAENTKAELARLMVLLQRMLKSHFLWPLTKRGVE